MRVRACKVHHGPRVPRNYTFSTTATSSLSSCLSKSRDGTYSEFTRRTTDVTKGNVRAKTVVRGARTNGYRQLSPTSRRRLVQGVNERNRLGVDKRANIGVRHANTHAARTQHHAQPMHIQSQKSDGSQEEHRRLVGYRRPEDYKRWSSKAYDARISRAATV